MPYKVEFHPKVDTVFARIPTVETPTEIAISAHPNPFNSAVTITYEGGSEFAKGLSTIEIYDVNGRRVASIIPPGPPLTRGEQGKSPLLKGGSALEPVRGGLFVWRPDPSITSGVYLVCARFDKLSDRGEGVSHTKRVVYLK
ncbi:MAG TPA: hypothetical protein ENN75_01505 [candidate division Zixibacteria bacterium]|nr:hypothetical protein [candidate division Zixibacteria bacterium]